MMSILIMLDALVVNFAGLAQIFEDVRCIHVIADAHGAGLLHGLQGLNIAYTLKPPACPSTGYIFLSHNYSKLYDLTPHRKAAVIQRGNRPSFDYEDLFGFKDIEVVIYDYESGRMYKPLEGRNWVPDLGSRKLRVSVFAFPPFSYHEKGKGLYDGVEKQVLDYITQGLSLELVEHPVFSWDFVRQDILDGKADLGIAGIWRGTLNFTLVDTTYPYIDVCNTLMVPKPHPLPADQFFYNLFDSYFYLAQAIVILGVGLILHYLDRFRVFGLIDQVLSVYQTSVMSSTRLVPEPLPLRMIFVTWCFTAILVNTWFSAAITKMLSSPLYSRPITTLEDVNLAKIVLIAKNRQTMTLLQATTNPNLASMIKNCLLYSETKQYANAAHMVNKLTDYVEVSRYLNVSNYNFMLISECFINDFFVFAMQKNSALKDVFDAGIIRLSETGFINCWFRGVVNRDLRLAEEIDLLYQVYPPKNNANLLTIEHMKGAVVLASCGYCLSTMVFILELIVWNMQLKEKL